MAGIIEQTLQNWPSGVATAMFAFEPAEEDDQGECAYELGEFLLLVNHLFDAFSSFQEEAGYNADERDLILAHSDVLHQIRKEWRGPFPKERKKMRQAKVRRIEKNSPLSIVFGGEPLPLIGTAVCFEEVSRDIQVGSVYSLILWLPSLSHTVEYLRYLLPAQKEDEEEPGMRAVAY